MTIAVDLGCKQTNKQTNDKADASVGGLRDQTSCLIFLLEICIVKCENQYDI